MLKKIIDEIYVSHPEIKVTVSGDQNVIVQADEALYSVFDNLISNAIIHGKADQIDIKIKVQKEFCQIRFADNGRGIPSEIMPKVFNDGFHYGETGHTGIGLYIVKKIIDELKGSISIEANLPQGAVFIIKLLKA